MGTSLANVGLLVAVPPRDVRDVPRDEGVVAQFYGDSHQVNVTACATRASVRRVDRMAP